MSPELLDAVEDFWRIHAKARKQGDDLAFLALILLQIWTALRGDPTKAPPSHLSLMVMRPYVAALLMDRGFDEREVRANLPDEMEKMERSYRELFEKHKANVADEDRPMRRRKWSQPNVVDLFKGSKK